MNNEVENHEASLKSLDEIILQITSQPKREYTQEEIDEARANLTLMNDRVFLAHYIDNKNNHSITGLADAVRKIHGLPPVPEVTNTFVQNVSLLDVLGRGMFGDLLSVGDFINIAVEVQNDKEHGYAVRGTITSGNAMRIGFNKGRDFINAPDVIGINILGFRLPQLAHRKEFVSRIVRAEYDSKVPFLDDKYSDYYIEMPKMLDMKKEDLPEAYHDLWDICCIFKTKVKDMEEAINMQAVKNPVALNLASEVKQTVTQNNVVHETLDRRSELIQLHNYIKNIEKEAAERAVATGMETMIITAFQANAPLLVIETMREKAGISESRIAELKKQAQAV